MTFVESVAIETLIVANHVETVNGLLYVSGGGWNVTKRLVSANGTPVPNHMGVAVVIAVPWNETNREYAITMDVCDADSKVVANVNAKLNVGRSPTLNPGTTQYPAFSLAMDLVFPHPGEYVIVARIDDSDVKERRWPFQVLNA